MTGVAAEVDVGEVVDLADDVPIVLVVADIGAGHAQPGAADHRAVVVMHLNRRAERVHAECQAAECTAGLVAEVAAEHLVGVAIGVGAEVERALGDARPVGEVGVVRQLAAAQRGLAAGPGPHRMRRQDAAFVFELDEARPADRSLQVGAVVEVGVPQTVGGVEAAEPNRQRIVHRVAQLQPLQVHGDAAILPVLDHQLGQALDPIAELRREVQVERAGVEATQLARIVARRPGGTDIGEAVHRQPAVAAAPVQAFGELGHTVLKRGHRLRLYRLYRLRRLR